MTKFSDLLRKKFPYKPTLDQIRLFEAAGEFLQSRQRKAVLLINGYPGSGQTSVLKAMIKTMPLLNYKIILLASNGRAAKLISRQMAVSATTLQKKLYKAVMDSDKGQHKLKRQKNFHKNAVFIIEGAALLGGESESVGRSLFSDLIEFVFEHESNKLVVIGDIALMHPTAKTAEPVLCRHLLSDVLGLQVFPVDFSGDIRQEQHSGILFNAMQLRKQGNCVNHTISLCINGYNNIFKINGTMVEEALCYAYDKFGTVRTMVICRSHQLTNKYNELIRRGILFYDEELVVGDILMIARNNYLYPDRDSHSNFLENDEIVEVLKIIRLEDCYGFRFADLLLKLVDYPEQEPFEAKIILDTLHAITPSLPMEDFKKLYWEISKGCQKIESRKERNERVLMDPYLNALQVKYAYALTVTSAQGGHWPCVFVDHGFMTQEMVNAEFVRWLYAAITRSVGELYLVNFKATFFEN